MGRAHSINDLIVFFEKRKVLAAGDLVWTNRHPILLDKNVNLKLWISYLDKMERSYDVQTVVPGHGNISGKDSISNMKEYFTSILHSIDSHAELKKLKYRYSEYSTFPFFGNFSRTVKIMKREIRNSSFS